jgi:hypothetical protein
MSELSSPPITLAVLGLYYKIQYNRDWHCKQEAVNETLRSARVCPVKRCLYLQMQPANQHLYVLFQLAVPRLKPRTSETND